VTSGGSSTYSQENYGDILVVMKNDLWKGSHGDSIQYFFSEPVLGLAAPEPMFTLTQISELSVLSKKYKNIIIINDDMDDEMTKIELTKGVHVVFQSIFTVDAPSADSAIACISRNKDLIIDHFLIKSRDATIEEYTKSFNKEIVEKILEKYQIDIVIPSFYRLDADEEDFMWISRKEGGRNLNILIWKYPYLHTDQIQTDSLIFKMNAMTRKIVSGDVAGSYMTNESKFPAEVNRFEKDSIYSVQMNGLWQMVNEYKGGPYVSQTIVDQKRGQLVTAHAFVYNPNRDKRQLIRQLEAILYSMTPAEVIED